MSYEQSKELILQLEKLTNTQVFFLFTKGGYSISDELETILTRLISEVKDDKRPITLLLQTSGGDADTGLFIINALKTHSKKVTVAVYRKCMSTGTIMALKASKILMGKYAYLGPIDGQISNTKYDLVPKKVIANIAERPNIPNGLNPLMIGYYEESNKYESSVLYPIILEHCKNDDTVAKNLLEFLTSRGHHSYRVFYDEAKKVGFNVRKMSSKVEDIVEDLIFLAEEEMNFANNISAFSYAHTAKNKSEFETPIITNVIFQNSKVCWLHKCQYYVKFYDEKPNAAASLNKWEKADF